MEILLNYILHIFFVGIYRTMLNHKSSSGYEMRLLLLLVRFRSFYHSSRPLELKKKDNKILLVNISTLILFYKQRL